MHSSLGSSGVGERISSDDGAKLCETSNIVGLPELGDRLLVIGSRADEQLLGEINEIGRERRTLLDEGDCLRSALGRHIDVALGVDWSSELGETRIVGHADILGVEPLCLIGIEARTALGDLVEGESLDKLIHGKNLLLRAGIPTEKGEHIDERLGKIATLAVTHGGRAVGGIPLEREDGETELIAIALGELTLTLWFEKQGQVGELWTLPSEGTVEEIVEREGGQPLLATDDVGNLHQMVVYDIGEVVCRELVGTLIEHLVVKGLGIYDDVTADDVIHLDILGLWHLEADYPLVATLDTRLDLSLREGERGLERIAHCRIVSESLASSLSLLAESIERLGGVERIVGVAALDKLLSVFEINLLALALAVWGVWSTLLDALVGYDAAPFEALDDVGFGAWYETLAIGVLDAEDEIAAMLASEEIIVEGSAHTTDVESAGGAGGETDPYSAAVVCHDGKNRDAVVYKKSHLGEAA